ncbi:MAG: hypothetical protein ACK521_05750 [bacterium]
MDQIFISPSSSVKALGDVISIINKAQNEEMFNETKRQLFNERSQLKLVIREDKEEFEPLLES